MTQEKALRKLKQIVKGSVTEQTDGQFDEYTEQVIYGKENIDEMLNDLETLIEEIYKAK